MKSFHAETSKFFDREIDPELTNYTSINVDVTSQIMQYLTDLGWSQKDFAKKLGKSEAEVSKWLSGVHNLTLKSIAKMQTSLKREIITTPQKAQSKYREIKYVTLKIHARPNLKGSINTRFIEYEGSGQIFKKVI